LDGRLFKRYGVKFLPEAALGKMFWQTDAVVPIVPAATQHVLTMKNHLIRRK